MNESVRDFLTDLYRKNGGRDYILMDDLKAYLDGMTGTIRAYEMADFIEELGRQFHENSALKGFWLGQQNKGEKIALIHSELSEALEFVRKPGPDDKVPHLPGEVVEMADAFIRILDYCRGFDLPIGRAVVLKHAYNKKRPFKHGKAF